jgi:ferredoxin
MESPFDVLRIEPDADEEEIEAAYRKRVKQVHPDHGGSAEEFREIRAAYEKLEAGYRSNGASAERDEVDDRTEDADDRTEDADETQRVSSEVTYLNYDILSDFGWRTDDGDLFEKAAAADLDEVNFGRFLVDPGQSLLEAAEDHDFAWPFACRGGACANCAILLLEGELSMPVSHVLPADLMERGFRLSCNGMAVSDELKVIYNVKHMPELEELLLPPDPFEQAYPNG